MTRVPYSPVVHHTVSIVQVEGIVWGARRHGLDVDALLRRAGIAPELLTSPRSRVTQAQYGRLMRVLCRATRDELWGLCARPLPMGSFATACRMLVHCRTLGDALRTGLRFMHRTLPAFVARLRLHDGVATIRIGPAADEPRTPGTTYAERAFLLLCFGLACWLVARRIALRELVYRDGPGARRGEGPQVFQAPLRLEPDWTGLCFDARWLELPVVQGPESLRAFLREAPANLIVRYRDRASVSERIRRLLRRHLADEMPSLDEVARALSTTPQTLRRRLRREGLGFQAIKDGLRRDLAVQYLSEPGPTLAQIAARLGYAETSTFHRAFKGWTGVAPGAYRARHLRDARTA